MEPDQLARVDTWADEHGIPGNRSEAIRRLVEKGLGEG
jgi:metal-responsive CopG/Arc/MetJ family transcriptional regulator